MRQVQSQPEAAKDKPEGANPEGANPMDFLFLSSDDESNPDICQI